MKTINMDFDIYKKELADCSLAGFKDGFKAAIHELVNLEKGKYGLGTKTDARMVILREEPIKYIEEYLKEDLYF